MKTQTESSEAVVAPADIAAFAEIDDMVATVK
jgi:hypothetical protein